MQIIEAKSVREKVRKAKKIMESAGRQIANVWFLKRNDGSLRKMSYRVGVKKPTYVRSPRGKGIVDNQKHNLLTVFDTNVMKYNKNGKLNGRGGYRSVPLDAVIRISTGGTIYRFA